MNDTDVLKKSIQITVLRAKSPIKMSTLSVKLSCRGGFSNLIRTRHSWGRQGFKINTLSDSTGF